MSTAGFDVLVSSLVRRHAHGIDAELIAAAVTERAERHRCEYERHIGLDPGPYRGEVLADIARDAVSDAELAVWPLIRARMGQSRPGTAKPRSQ